MFLIPQFYPLPFSQSIPNPFLAHYFPSLHAALDPKLILKPVILFTDDNLLHIGPIALLPPVINSQMHILIVQSAHTLLDLLCLVPEVIYDYLGNVLLEVLYRPINHK